MEQAINTALKNGWIPIEEVDYNHATTYGKPTPEWIEEAVCLSPDFWQALERGTSTEENTYEGKWRRMWHSFIDHIGDGEDINSFFTRLEEGILLKVN